MARHRCCVLVWFTASVISCCAVTCPAQERLPGDSVYRRGVASVSERSFPSEPVQQASAGEFPSLVVPGDADADDRASSDGALAGPVVTTVSSLLVVLAVFGGLVWISRRFGSSRTFQGALPEDVLRNLGGAAIDAKTRVTFLKVGARILVIGQTTAGDPQTLSEITDPEEVERLTNRCLGRPEIVGRRSGYPSGVETSRRDLAAG
ncbi:Flagellar biosynthesis protein, FliO [Stieleria maiorica]|uniref:Flagellar biosynthesis protein, FliO n=1 Tax=Stieleria maiorica TaxID=2795974 RepID=A0A5B9MQG8_9BACT|nr:flagellar biosynthetic protein FliO [Stieleria maiorica]QEG02016.1 Flagellar biosynthesis protein, FliO [Stieleria maiorica]